MRIVFLSKWHVLPANSGGRIRTLQILQYLAGRHELHLVYNLPAGDILDGCRLAGVHEHPVPTLQSQDRDARYFARLLANLGSHYPFNAEKDRDDGLTTYVRRLCERIQPDVVVCDFVQTALNCEQLHEWPFVLFQHNVEAEVFWRQADGSDNAPLRAIFGLQAQKMARFEANVLHRFDLIVAVSERDQRIFEDLYGCQHVAVIDTAVDVHRYEGIHPDRSSKQVLFLGGLDWIPNAEGVIRFCRRIWPRVREVVPDATFVVVGRRALQEVRAAVQSTEGATFVGEVPDTRPYLRQAAVAIVPVYMGGGTRMKIYEYMACGLPVVTTSLGCEGLPVRHNRHVLIADDDDTFAHYVAQCLTDVALATRIGDEGARFVRQNFSAEVVGRQFEGHLALAVERFRVRRQARLARI